MPVFHCVPVVVVGLNLCDHCVLLSVTMFVYACVTEREGGGVGVWVVGGVGGWLHALLQRFIAPGHEIFLVHLVSSVLSPLSLSLPLSPSLAFSSLKGGWGRGGGRSWKGRKVERGGGDGGGGNHHGYNATTNIHQIFKIQTNGSAL